MNTNRTQQDAVQGVSILGATGSIGSSSLDVLARHPQRFRVVALTAGREVDKLLALCERWQPELAVIADESLQQRLAQGLRARGLSTQAASGPQALVDAARWHSAHIVIAAIVGAAGLPATLAAAQAGKRLLLANKEAVVCAGALLMNAVRSGNAELIPLDSEHSAIAQCLAGSADSARDVRRLVLTASGGPFRTRSDLSQVTPQQAIAHPNWVMGRKISVDSATLMNKGLEVIEASWLFGFAAERIEVVIHPQSVIHSMVEFGDGSVMAQLGTPDMRTPIAYGLGFPQRIESGSESLDFLTMGTLTFEAPDHARFPCLGLAYCALRAGGQAPIALNAANEIAVDAFLEQRIAFLDIATVIETTLSGIPSCVPASIEEVLHIDEQARALARQQVQRCALVSVGVS